mgnify:FL=1|tara:strand:- start:402 stop:950 length:549 start_codon:yes stop_codon:yes gene_type:complete
MLKKSKKDFPNSTSEAFHHDGDVKIVKATIEHAGYLQNYLRQSDVRECMVYGATPWRALHIPFKQKNAMIYTGLYKDEPACMFGVSPFDDTKEIYGGSIWMLASYTIEKHPRKFLSASKKMCDYMVDSYDYVENVVPVDHERTIRWLDWLGFQFSSEPVSVNGYQCYRFVRCAKSLEVTFEL